MDSYQARALEMIASTQVRDALDLDREPEAVREQYGAGLDFLRARRLVEAGVSVVSVASRFPVRVPGVNDPGGWDTHGYNFKLLRAKLPIYDQAVYALLTDLPDRGLDKDVAVVIWGEFGRTPKIGDSTPDGRGHWQPAGLSPCWRAAVCGWDRSSAKPTPAPRRLASALTPRRTSWPRCIMSWASTRGPITLPDFGGRPQYLLDDPEPIAALV